MSTVSELPLNSFGYIPRDRLRDDGRNVYADRDAELAASPGEDTALIVKTDKGGISVLDFRPDVNSSPVAFDSEIAVVRYVSGVPAAFLLPLVVAFADIGLSSESRPGFWRRTIEHTHRHRVMRRRALYVGVILHRQRISPVKRRWTQMSPSGDPRVQIV